MILQQLSLFDEQGSKHQQSFRGGSRASLTALLENVWHLMMNVICGRKCEELLGKLSRNGSLQKMSQDFYQVRMEDFSEEYSMTFPKWGMMLDGQVFALHPLGLSTDENELRLLPTPVACDYKGGALRKNTKKQMSNLKEFIYTFSDQQTKSIYVSPEFLEAIMGFPTGWTELNH